MILNSTQFSAPNVEEGKMLRLKNHQEISQETATPVEEALFKASFKCLVDEIYQEANKLGDEVRVILSPSAK